MQLKVQKFRQTATESYAKNKIGKSLNANKKFLDEFYIGLTMYFRILG